MASAARVSKSPAAQDAAGIELERKRNALRADVVQAFSSAQTAQQRLQLSRQSLQLAEQGGCQAGTMYEGDRRIDMVVRLADAMLKDIEGLSALLIPVPAPLNGAANQIAFIALGEVASLDLVRSVARMACVW